MFPKFDKFVPIQQSVKVLVCSLGMFAITANAEIVDVQVGPEGNLTFSPSTVKVHAGDTVRWTWASGGHSVTSGSSCSSNSTFGSTAIRNAGDTYAFTFNNVGSFPYFCTPHCGAGMTGIINVAAGSVVGSSVNFEPYVGKWSLNFQSTLKLKVKRLSVIPINGSGSCDFSPSASSASAGGFQCEVLQNQKMVAMSGTLKLDKKGKHFTFAVDATTINEIATLIEDAVNGRAGITSPQVTIKQHGYSKLKANAFSLGPEKNIFKGTAKANVNGRLKSAAFSYKAKLTFTRTP